MSSSDLKAPETSPQPIRIVAGPAHSFLCDDEHIRVKLVEQVGNIPRNNNVGIDPDDIVVAFVHQMQESLRLHVVAIRGRQRIDIQSHLFILPDPRDELFFYRGKEQTYR